jgi:hypothetical protein
MAKFLNTELLNHWILKLIEKTERELIIIVPYIQTSDRIYNHLLEANKRDVQITLVYKENKLHPEERAKLEALDNLNLMHHPNVHAKCYYNENYLIVCSMNLYEYSGKNNREMGILLHRNDLKEEIEKPGAFGMGGDSYSLFNDAISEIRLIVNGAHIEKTSRKTKKDGFEIEIIKNEKEKEEEFCKLLNSHFGHKKFEVEFNTFKWSSICKNYFDRIDLIIEHRAILFLNFEEQRLKEIYSNVNSEFDEFQFHGFKVYWNYHKGPIYLYVDRKHSFWDDSTGDVYWKRIKAGIDGLIEFIRPSINLTAKVK